MNGTDSIEDPDIEGVHYVVCACGSHIEIKDLAEWTFEPEADDHFEGRWLSVTCDWDPCGACFEYWVANPHLRCWSDGRRLVLRETDTVGHWG